MSDESGWDGVERREGGSRWHVGREVPIAVLIALLVQTAGGIWWLAQLSAKIDHAVSSITEFRVERYTREDARRDRELIVTLIEQVKQRDLEHERRMSAIEAGIERMRQGRVQ